MENWIIGGVTLYPYGAAIAAGALIALAVYAALLRRKGLGHCAGWFAVLAVPLGFLSARLMYCLMKLDMMLGSEGFGLFLSFTGGGYNLFGALIGIIIALKLTSRITKTPISTLADSLIWPMIVFVIVVRIVGAAYGQGLGMNLDSWFDFEEEDPAYRYSLFRPEFYSFWQRLPFAVMNEYETWHWAIFVPEILSAIAIGWFVSRIEKRPDGAKAMLALICFSAFQILWEGMLRGDVLYMPFSLGFVRANQMIALFFLLGALAYCVHKLPQGQRGRAFGSAFWRMFIGALFVIAMEFAAFEKKITLIAWMPADVCHILMAFGCLIMAWAVYPVWKRAYPALA